MVITRSLFHMYNTSSHKADSHYYLQFYLTHILSTSNKTQSNITRYCEQHYTDRRRIKKNTFSVLSDNVAFSLVKVQQQLASISWAISRPCTLSHCRHGELPWQPNVRMGLMSSGSQRPLLTLTPTMISNCMPNNVWDEITHPFTNFHGCTVRVWD